MFKKSLAKSRGRKKSQKWPKSEGFGGFDNLLSFFDLIMKVLIVL